MKRLINALVYLIVGTWLYIYAMNTGHSGFEAGSCAIIGSFLIIEITKDIVKDIIKAVL